MMNFLTTDQGKTTITYLIISDIAILSQMISVDAGAGVTNDFPGEQFQLVCKPMTAS